MKLWIHSRRFLNIIILGTLVAKAVDGQVAPASKASKSQVEIELPSMQTKLNLLITTKSPNESAEFYFGGMQACSKKKAYLGATLHHLGQCLAFHTTFAAEPWTYFPIALIHPFKTSDIAADLEAIYKKMSITVSQERTDQYAWGNGFYWRTDTRGSAVYVYLQPTEKPYAVRIGPMAGSVLQHFDLGLPSATWKPIKLK